MDKILQELQKAKEQKIFLEEFLVWSLEEQNKYIKINDKNEIEIMNYIIQDTQEKIENLKKVIAELERDAKNSR
jgi:hypothetical protein